MNLFIPRGRCAECGKDVLLRQIRVYFEPDGSGYGLQHRKPDHRWCRPVILPHPLRLTETPPARTWPAPPPLQVPARMVDLPQVIADYERRAILWALAASDHSTARAALLLGLNYTTFRAKMRRMGIVRQVRYGCRDVPPSRIRRLRA